MHQSRMDMKISKERRFALTRVLNRDIARFVRAYG
jgi:hypothetical protein